MKIEMKKWALLCFVGLALFSGCGKDDATPASPDVTDTTPAETSDYLIGEWTMNLSKSYATITCYDDKKAAALKGIDAITGATGNENEGEGRTTYMNNLYSAASITFTADGSVVRSYTAQGNNTTTTMSYVREGNVIEMGGSKFYVTQLTKYSLKLEAQRIYMAKGKDVYSEFLHLEYYRNVK